MQEFIQQSPDEEAHVFKKTLIAKRLQFTIHETEPVADIYYWRINLIGCLESEGISGVYNHNRTDNISSFMRYDI